jgi:hypothetical protein
MRMVYLSDKSGLLTGVRGEENTHCINGLQGVKLWKAGSRAP